MATGNPSEWAPVDIETDPGLGLLKFIPNYVVLDFLNYPYFRTPTPPGFLHLGFLKSKKPTFEF